MAGLSLAWTDAMIAQVVYIACCLIAMGAIAFLQGNRMKDARGCLWWAYNVLLLAIGWEAIDAYMFGAPGFPASRWLLLPSLAMVKTWWAVSDWHKAKTTGEP